MLALLVAHSTVWAQAPDADETVYTNACFIRSNGGTKGQALRVTRFQAGFIFMFQDFRDYPRPPEEATGQIVAEKITFDAKVVGLAVHFTGTITPQEIRGRFSNAENVDYYNADVRWQKLPPRTLMPDCPSG